VSDNGSAPSSHSEDSVLARGVSNGDVAAFGLLYDRYARAVYATATHMLGAADADEMLQEIFLRLWLHADQFDPERGTFRAWFMAIARHSMLRQLRSRSRQHQVQVAANVEDLLSRVPDSAPDVEAEASLHEETRTLIAELNTLPAEQRRVLVLAYFGGLSQSSIAHQLDLPLGTIKKRTRLGLQKLRRAMAPDWEPGETEPARDEPLPLSKARMTDGL
jgi:RNA polymerase sigma-70 factor (ECF subfamily)